MGCKLKVTMNYNDLLEYFVRKDDIFELLKHSDLYTKDDLLQQLESLLLK